MRELLAFAAPGAAKAAVEVPSLDGQLWSPLLPLDAPLLEAPPQKDRHAPSPLQVGSPFGFVALKATMCLIHTATIARQTDTPVILSVCLLF